MKRNEAANSYLSAFWAKFDREIACVGVLVVKVCYARFFSSLLIIPTMRFDGGLDFSHCEMRWAWHPGMEGLALETSRFSAFRVR